MNEYELEIAREQRRLERELLAANEHLWPTLSRWRKAWLVLVFTVFLLVSGRVRIVR